MNCEEKILDLYNENSLAPESSKEVIGCKCLIKLMKNSAAYSNIAFSNCVLLVLNLFVTDSIERLNQKTKLLKNITDDEKSKLIKVLKAELSLFDNC